jgi:hypothetical protein
MRLMRLDRGERGGGASPMCADGARVENADGWRKEIVWGREGMAARVGHGGIVTSGERRARWCDAGAGRDGPGPL